MASPFNRQNPSLTPTRSSRSLLVPVVLVISVHPFRFRIVPSGFSCRLDLFAPGLANCGRFVTLNASMRNCRFERPDKVIRRNNPISHCATPGPRSELNAAVPILLQFAITVRQIEQ
jgi:hypothetical protein